MKDNYLTKWLCSRCTKKVESSTTNSDYYQIDGMVIRVSDHLPSRTGHDIDIVFISERRYLIILSNAKFRQPILCTTWNDGIEYVTNWLKYVRPYFMKGHRDKKDSSKTQTTYASVMPPQCENETILQPVENALCIAPMTDSVIQTIDNPMNIEDVQIDDDIEKENINVYQILNNPDNDEKTKTYLHIVQNLSPCWFSSHIHLVDLIINPLKIITSRISDSQRMIDCFIHYANDTMTPYPFKAKVTWLNNIMAKCEKDDFDTSDMTEVTKVIINTTPVIGVKDTNPDDDRLFGYLKSKFHMQWFPKNKPEKKQTIITLMKEISRIIPEKEMLDNFHNAAHKSAATKPVTKKIEFLENEKDVLYKIVEKHRNHCIMEANENK